VRVNAINPGAIATDRLKTRVKKLAEDKGIALEEATAEMAKPLGVSRFAEPGEIANAVAFLASGLAGYCQGSILDIDGGQTKTL
jgi:NAD(P)-dependent dehydrogenase (short-subunit alcohol dehydrogenase family)